MIINMNMNMNADDDIEFDDDAIMMMTGTWRGSSDHSVLRTKCKG